MVGVLKNLQRNENNLLVNRKRKTNTVCIQLYIYMSRENVAELNRGRSTARRHTFSGIHGQCPLALRESSEFQNLDKKRELAGWRAVVSTSWLNGLVPQ